MDELAYVINFEIPNIPETYVHRIGRTGRAGANGTSFSFCDAEERVFLRDIQKLIGKQIPVITDHPYVTASVAPVEVPKQAQSPNKPKTSEGKKRVWFNRR